MEADPRKRQAVLYNADGYRKVRIWCLVLPGRRGSQWTVKVTFVRQ